MCEYKTGQVTPAMETAIQREVMRCDMMGYSCTMSYVARGLGAVFAGMCALAAQGLHVGREAQLAEGTARVQRGLTHLRYIDRWGWRSFAKGGWDGEKWTSNNEDWDAAWAAETGYEAPCRWGLGDCLVSALTGVQATSTASRPTLNAIPLTLGGKYLVINNAS